MKVAVVLRTVLKGIPPILSPELLAVLARMGHADEIVIADANFPSASVAKNSILIRADGMVRPESMRGVAGSLTPIAGHSAIPILKAIAQLLPLDKYVPTPAFVMKKEPSDKDLPVPILKDYQKIVHLEEIERFQFYERAKTAFAVVATGETALYANIILKKGVIPPQSQ